MTGRTEERLRDATTALGNTLQCEDIPPLRLPPLRLPPLRLPDTAGRSPGARFMAPRPPVHRRWLAPLLAAASVAAVIGLIVVVTRNLPHLPRPPAPPGSAESGPPRFLVTTVGGQATVRSGVSGGIIAQIPRPAGIDAYAGVAAAAGNATYFLAGAIARKNIPKIVFYRLVLGARGRPGQVHRLPGQPLTVPRPAGRTLSRSLGFYFAVAPDGSALAYASSSPLRDAGTLGKPGTTPPGRSDHIVVQDVATGMRRTWSARESARPAITQVSWGPSGELGYAVTLWNSGVSHHAVIDVARGTVGAFMVLDTTAPGSSLFRNSRIVSYGSAHGHFETREFVLGGAISPDGQHVYAELLLTRPPEPAGQAAGTARIAEVSAVTGRIIRPLPLRAPSASSMSIDGTGRYLLFRRFLAYPVSSAGSSQLEWLDLKTGRKTLLPAVFTRDSVADVAW